MDKDGGFIFADEYHLPESQGFVGRLARGISDVDQLLLAIEKVLKFPAYFGANWNALSDCLRDFHWVSETVVVLFHKDIPALSPRDLAMYIDILREAVADWRVDAKHELVVVFPTTSRNEIRRLLHSTH